MDDATPQPTEAAPGAGLDIEIGRKLASGRDADVFEIDGGRVLRRYRATSKTASGATKTSELEADVMRFVRSQGYPVPAIHAVSGPDMVMDRVDGPTMLKDLGRRPWTVWRHARLLARLHNRLHTISAPDWVPTYASHPAFAMSDSEATATEPPAGGGAAEGNTLLHLDLHPDNVILSRSGPVVIDWRNARRGEGAIDVASTWLIMATSQLPDTGPKALAMDVVRRLFVYAFVRHADQEAAPRVIPLVARYRLADRNLLESERPAIYAFAHRTSASL